MITWICAARYQKRVKQREAKRYAMERRRTNDYYLL